MTDGEWKAQMWEPDPMWTDRYGRVRQSPREEYLNNQIRDRKIMIDDLRRRRMGDLAMWVNDRLGFRQWEMYKEAAYTGLLNRIDARSPHAVMNEEEIEAAYQDAVKYLEQWSADHPASTANRVDWVGD